ncbi:MULTISPECIES: GNAT family N-acetyltransferase [Priestia]|uniref:GNAT family N-acetyltransferase n=1 Tax=Priestia TaxID=2800373 RepID=UPI001C8D0C05|nr:MULTISPECIES: GNAT family protein [Priestia]MBY0003329.1 GNAT family N-acetyltransferase [Priestia aryabhattai]UYV54508.1 GNAT family N-acetyltransferase [Priestia megaterium]
MPLPKVKLRELNLSDVEDRYKWSLDKQVTKYLVVPDEYPPFTRENTEQWIKLCISKSNGYEQRAVMTEEDKHIGWVDLKNFDKVNKNAELGIAIGDREYWGKGYGMSALLEMLRIGFLEFNLVKVWLRVDIDNLSAVKSYERAGFINEGLMRSDRYRKGEFVDRYRFSILKEEFIRV